ncbi:hypothetical protein VSR68_23540 [Paraburkholderia phymatum]|uniref:hypothetical protein n=1 Tax=Paraburkholderia phymatum TaxID=148447 RepID=UPI00317AFBA0
MNLVVIAGVMLGLLLLDLFTGEFRKPRASSKREIGANLLTIVIAHCVRALLMVAIGWPLARFLPQWGRARGRACLSGRCFLPCWWRTTAFAGRQRNNNSPR